MAPPIFDSLEDRLGHLTLETKVAPVGARNMSRIEARQSQMVGDMSGARAIPPRRRRASQLADEAPNGQTMQRVTLCGLPVIAMRGGISYRHPYRSKATPRQATAPIIISVGLVQEGARQLSPKERVELCAETAHRHTVATEALIALIQSLSKSSECL